MGLSTRAIRPSYPGRRDSGLTFNDVDDGEEDAYGRLARARKVIASA